MPRPSASSGGALRIRAGVRDLRQRVRAGVRGLRHDRSRATARRPAAGRVRDRLPDARSVSEAEDVVQEALLRVHQALQAGEQIASPRAYVATVTTRLAINELRSAR